MADINFTTEAFGYSIDEVNKYLAMLQTEYRNAVQWGDSIEEQLESEKELSAKLKSDLEDVEKENKKLLSDCKLLAAKLKSLTENTGRVVETSDKNVYDADAAKIVNSIISAANKKAQEIVSEAYKTQDTLFSEKIAETRREIEKLEEKKLQLKSEVEACAKFKADTAKALSSLLKELED